MKKLFGIITVSCAICFFANSNASAGSAVSASANAYSFVQDTNPMPKRDSTKWNKKKHKDSTSRSKTDTLHAR